MGPLATKILQVRNIGTFKDKIRFKPHSNMSGGIRYNCDCTGSEYEGRHCEIESPHCDQSSCMNGGICLNQPTGIICECGPEFTGLRCENNLRVSLNHPYLILTIFQAILKNCFDWKWLKWSICASLEGLAILFSISQMFSWINLRLSIRQSQEKLSFCKRLFASREKHAE